MQSKDNTCPACGGKGYYINSFDPRADTICTACKGSGQQEDKPVMDEQLAQKLALHFGIMWGEGNPKATALYIMQVMDMVKSYAATEYDRGKVETIDKIIAETWDNPEFDHHSSSAWGDYLMKLKEGSKDAQA